MGGRGSSSGAKGGAKTSSGVSTAKLPTDRLTVKNYAGGITSLNAADDNDLVFSFKVDAPEALKNNPTVQRMETVNLDVYGAKIEGKSEKQVQFAQDIRARTVYGMVNSAWTDYKRTYDNAKARGIDAAGNLTQNGILNASEMVAHKVAQNESLSKLLSMTSARDIIDKFR